ncbi:hypothetical protein [Streptosporangium sp. NPDC002607]
MTEFVPAEVLPWPAGADHSRPAGEEPEHPFTAPVRRRPPAVVTSPGAYAADSPGGHVADCPSRPAAREVPAPSPAGRPPARRADSLPTATAGPGPLPGADAGPAPVEAAASPPAAETARAPQTGGTPLIAPEAGAAKPVSLRDAGIRSAEPAAFAPEPVPPPAGTMPPPPAAQGTRDDLEADWRDLGRRLLAEHPPAGHHPAAPPPETAAHPAPADPAHLPTAIPPPPTGPHLAARTTGDTGPGQAAAPVAATTDPEPGLTIEHLEVHIVAPAAPHHPEPPPATPSRAGAWDPAARHYVERW